MTKGIDYYNIKVSKGTKEQKKMKKLKEIKIAELKGARLSNSIMLQEMGHALYEKHYITDYRVRTDFKTDKCTLFITNDGKYEG